MSETDNFIGQFLYYPGRLPPDLPPPEWARGAREVWMNTKDDLRIHGLWWDKPAGEPVILFLHGNAQEVYSWSLIYEEFSKLQYRLLLIDYRGYGKSQGKPFEEGLYLDGRAALEWLYEQGIKEHEIIVFGKSLGGAIACEISQQLKLKALILESTFTSLQNIASGLFPFLPADLNLKRNYSSIEKVGNLHCPVLVIHGEMDELIPLQDGIKLFEAVPEPKELYLVPGAGHNDVSLIGGDQYVQRIASFLRRKI